LEGKRITELRPSMAECKWAFNLLIYAAAMTAQIRGTYSVQYNRQIWHFAVWAVNYYQIKWRQINRGIASEIKSWNLYCSHFASLQPIFLRRILATHCVQTGSGAHPASYPMDTRGSAPGGKATGAWSWPLTSI
jgi:hypothetical protein